MTSGLRRSRRGALALLALGVTLACAGRGQPVEQERPSTHEYLGLLASAPGSSLTFRPCIPAWSSSALPSIWMVEGGRELLELLLERRGLAVPRSDGVLAGLARVRGHVPRGVRPGYRPVSSHVILREVLEVEWDAEVCPAVLPAGVVGSVDRDPSEGAKTNDDGEGSR